MLICYLFHSLPSTSRSWFDLINPFAASSSRGSGPGEDGDGSGAAGGADAGSLVGMGPGRTMTLRPIAMRDFELAVMKLKESRSHCGNPLTKARIELD